MAWSSSRCGLFLALVACGACSHAPPSPRQTDSEPSAASSPQTQPTLLPRSAPPAPAFVVVVPSRPPAAAYGGPLRPTDDAHRVVADLRRAIIKRSVAAGFPAPQPDGRLDLVAADLAMNATATSHELVSFLAHHYGVAEPQPNILALGTDAGDADAIGLVMNQVEATLSRAAWPRLGLAAVRTQGYLQVMLLLGMVDIAFDSFPRTLAGKAVAPLQGQLPPGFGNPQLVVTTPTGSTGRLPIRLVDRNFKGTFSCMAGPGRYDVELLAEAARGPEVLLNAPVFCDAPVPTQFTPTRDEFGEATTARAVEVAMVKAINRERAKRTLAPLTVNDRLQQVARLHTEGMARVARVSHVSANGDKPVDRARAAGISPVLLSENVGSATSAAAVHDGFMTSPGHRANVLESQATNVGVGVVQVREGDGLVVWYVTELFARFTPLQPAPHPQPQQ